MTLSAYLIISDARPIDKLVSQGPVA